ncbi:hypothetical protein JCM19233_5772 [Vibrio astriarenae]|nr:hypothetical protein JCM19233_5772 [Vibrio sp. C7]
MPETHVACQAFVLFMAQIKMQPSDPSQHQSHLDTLESQVERYNKC